MAETLADEDARKFVLDRRITSNVMGSQIAETMRRGSMNWNRKQLAAYLIAVSLLPTFPRAAEEADGGPPSVDLEFVVRRSQYAFPARSLLLDHIMA